MQNRSTKILLSVLHFILATGAIYGGSLMIIQPDGGLLGMKVSQLTRTPFHNFMIPGIILLLIFGIGPLVIIAGLWKRNSFSFLQKFNIYPSKHWTFAFSVYCGISLMIWIAVQQLWTDYFILQPIICLLGVAILICTLSPSIMLGDSIPEEHGKAQK